MIAYAWVRSSGLEDAIHALQRLSAPIRPSSYAATDRVARGRAADMADEARFRRFRRANPEGYFLFSTSCTYNVSARRKEPFSIFTATPTLGDLSSDFALQILHALASADLEFGFACEREEYLHRNKVVREFGEEVIEGWVGRDIRKYTPGLYWTTLLSTQRYKSLRISQDDLPKGAKVSMVPLDCVEVRAFPKPREWKRWAAHIDDVCESRSGVFSMRRITQDLASVTDALGFVEVVRKFP